MRDVLKISQCKDTKNSLFRASIYGNMHRNLTFYMSFCRFSYSAVIYDLLYNNLAVFQFNLQSFEVVQFLNEDLNLILRFPYEMEHQLMCITVTGISCHMIVIRNLGEHLIERHVVKDNSRIAYNLCRPLPRSPSMGRVIINRCVSLPTTTYSFNQQMVGITSVFILVDDVTGFLFGICCWMVEHFKKLEDSVQVCIGTANERICIRKRETNRSNGRENGTKPMFFAKKQ